MKILIHVVEMKYFIHSQMWMNVEHRSTNVGTRVKISSDRSCVSVRKGTNKSALVMTVKVMTGIYFIPLSLVN